MRYYPIQTLTTRRLVLRRLELSDVPAYFQHLGSSAAVTEHMLWQPHQSLAESEASIRKVLSRYETGRCYRWAIVRREDGQLLGLVELLRFNEETGTCSFAYMLGQPFWNQGYATEALEAAFAFAFHKMQVQAITADHFAENPASGAVMRKAGMVFQRRLPQKYEKQGILHDALEYTITARQWAGR